MRHPFFAFDEERGALLRSFRPEIRDSELSSARADRRFAIPSWDPLVPTGGRDPELSNEFATQGARSRREASA